MLKTSLIFGLTDYQECKIFMAFLLGFKGSAAMRQVNSTTLDLTVLNSSVAQPQ